MPLVSSKCPLLAAEGRDLRDPAAKAAAPNDEVAAAAAEAASGNANAEKQPADDAAEAKTKNENDVVTIAGKENRRRRQMRERTKVRQLQGRRATVEEATMANAKAKKKGRSFAVLVKNRLKTPGKRKERPVLFFF